MGGISSSAHSQSLHRQHSHRSSSLQGYPHSHHYDKNPARSSTIRLHHNHKVPHIQPDFQPASSLNKEQHLSDQLTLRPPATFSDLNPITESSSSFRGGHCTTAVVSAANSDIVKAPQPPSNNSSSLMASNQHGSVAEVVETTKSSEFSNTSVESLVSNLCVFIHSYLRLSIVLSAHFLLQYKKLSFKYMNLRKITN